MAGANKLRLFLVPGDRATQMWTDRCEDLKLPPTIFRHINRFFGYRFTPSIHLLDLNGAHHRIGERRKLAQFSHGRSFDFSCTSEQWEKCEANQRHGKQCTDKN